MILTRITFYPNYYQVVEIALDGFENFLKVVRKAANSTAGQQQDGKTERNGEKSEYEKVLASFSASGGLDIIRHLQNHPDPRVCKKAVAVLQKHLMGESMRAIDEETSVDEG